MSKIVGLILVTLLVAVAAGGAGVAAVGRQGPPAAVTHGVIVGDVTSSSALLWARADRESTLSVALSGGGHGDIPRARAEAAHDFTARVALEHLLGARPRDVGDELGRRRVREPVDLHVLQAHSEITVRDCSRRYSVT